MWITNIYNVIMLIETQFQIVKLARLQKVYYERNKYMIIKIAEKLQMLRKEKGSNVCFKDFVYRRKIFLIIEI